MRHSAASWQGQQALAGGRRGPQGKQQNQLVCRAAHNRAREPQQRPSLSSLITQPTSAVKPPRQPVPEAAGEGLDMTLAAACSRRTRTDAGTKAVTAAKTSEAG